MALLETKKLSKHFGGVIALDNVDLKIMRGELVGLIGPNGSGKTTFYNCVTGFYKPTSGKVFFNGRDITGLPNHKVCKMGIARTFQIPRPFLGLTVLDNVAVGALSTGVSLEEAREKAKEILNFLMMDKYAGFQASKLNFAYRRRCEIARALATEPSLLLLDETFAGLNPAEIDEMVEVVKKIWERGVTIMLTEHIMKVVMSLAERIIVFNQGRLIADGSPKEIASNEEVIEAYLGRVI
ncbi:MAG: ABC transporter ATP-binding protein [Candidatus Bathyarchaeia archaeon]